jgi:hypothetical protein
MRAPVEVDVLVVGSKAVQANKIQSIKGQSPGGLRVPKPFDRSNPSLLIVEVCVVFFSPCFRSRCVAVPLLFSQAMVGG